MHIIANIDHQDAVLSLSIVVEAREKKKKDVSLEFSGASRCYAVLTFIYEYYFLK